MTAPVGPTAAGVERLARQLGISLSQWQTAALGQLYRDGYAGSRCGWYPAKPRGWRP